MQPAMAAFRKLTSEPAPRLRVAGWGGRRPGAGRPRKGPIASQPHTARPRFETPSRLRVTLRLIAGYPPLPARDAAGALAVAVKVAAARFDFRIVEVRLDGAQIQLRVEADHHEALWRGMQSFQISAARALNRATGQRGQVFADRYHAQLLGPSRRPTR